MLQPYLQTSDQAGKACQGETLELMKIIKKFCNIGVKATKLYFFDTDKLECLSLTKL